MKRYLSLSIPLVLVDEYPQLQWVILYVQLYSHKQQALISLLYVVALANTAIHLEFIVKNSNIGTEILRNIENFKVVKMYFRKVTSIFIKEIGKKTAKYSLMTNNKNVSLTL